MICIFEIIFFSGPSVHDLQRADLRAQEQVLRDRVDPVGQHQGRGQGRGPGEGDDPAGIPRPLPERQEPGDHHDLAGGLHDLLVLHECRYEFYK